MDDGPTRPGRRHRVGRHAVALGAGVTLAILTALLFPADGRNDAPVHRVGAIAPANVIAPIEFRVPRAEQDVKRDRDAAAQRVEPLFRFDTTALESARAEVLSFGAALDSVAVDGGDGRTDVRASILAAAASHHVKLAPAEADYLAFPARRAAILGAVVRTYERLIPDGVAASADLLRVRGTVRVSRGLEEVQVKANDIVSDAELVRTARRLHPDPESPVGDAAFLHTLTAFFKPSLVIDSATTSQRRADARSQVATSRFTVQAGEKIVGAHEVVDEEDHAKLVALHDAVGATREGRAMVKSLAGNIVLNFAVLAVFGIALLLYRPAVYAAPRVMLVLSVAMLFVLVGAAVGAWNGEASGTLVPIAVASLIVSALIDSRLALVAALVLAILIGTQAPFRGTQALLVVLTGGAAAAFSVRALTRRTQAYSSMLAVALAYAVVAVAVGLAEQWPIAEVARAATLGLVNAAVSVAIAMALLPSAEALCGIDTHMKLLEWSDLNHPLLRRLATEAPGTYAHTLAIASLTEAACIAVGANGLLGRVGTYFHDIGKLEKPQYFVENQQKGRNPHDKLKPSASASIIRNHVRDGLELAEEYKLPRSIRAFITEHHGTAPISFFREKARERDGVLPPEGGEYAYPGPRPRSVETAICMLADAVEAATRALPDPTPAKMREVIDRLVQARIEQGQLREAPITLAQLDTVKSEFARVLEAMHHSRIDYPTSPSNASSADPSRTNGANAQDARVASDGGREISSGATS